MAERQGKGEEEGGREDGRTKSERGLPSAIWTAAPAPTQRTSKFTVPRSATRFQLPPPSITHRVASFVRHNYIQRRHQPACRRL